MKKVMVIATLMAMLSPVAWGATTIVDDHFDDGSLGTNTNGIGTGFNVDGVYFSESDSMAKFTNARGSHRPRMTSKNGAAFSGGVNRFEFRGVSFAKNPDETHKGSTDRLYLGVKGSDVASTDVGGNPDTGFYIQIESDSVATGSGNGYWTGTSTLFYESSTDVSTKLASWTFDVLNWDNYTPLAPNPEVLNFTPVLNIILELDSVGYSLSIGGDTISNLTGSLSGTYAAAGITNELTTGYAALWSQTEGPCINTTIDQIVITENANVSIVAPANNASGVPVNQLIEWTVNEPTVALIDLYFSTDPNLQAVHKKLSQVPASTTSYQPSPVLDFTTDYFWRVDSYEPNTLPGATDYFVNVGPVWTFKTRSQAPTVSAVTPALITADDDGTDSVSLSVTATSADTYQWYKVGEPDLLLTEGGKYTGVATATLTINNIVSADEGTYYCSVENANYPSPVTNEETGPGQLVMRRMVIHYPLDTVVDGVTPDVVNGYDMVLANNVAGKQLPSLVSGVSQLGGNGLLFNNSNSSDPNYYGMYASAGDVDVETMGDGLTIEVWVNWAATNGDYQGIINRRTSWDAGSMMWQLEQANTGGGVGFTRKGSSETAKASLPQGEWTHIAATYNQPTGTIRIYKNGELLSTTSGFTYGLGTDAALKIGCNDLSTSGVASGFFNGALDDIRIYNYARTTEQIGYAYLDVVQTGYVCNRELFDLLYDFNNNCIIDLGDFAMFAQTWLNSYRMYPQQP